MSVRKYLTEFGLNMFGNYFYLLQQDQLKTFTESKIPIHIYFICTRPRISLDVKTLIFHEHSVEGNFLIQKQDAFESIPFNVPNQLGSNVRFECPYPYTEITIYNTNNEIVAQANVALLMNMFGIYDVSLDLEVKYIGQSYGIEGARTAPSRLMSHSTLQEIYSDIIRTSPDKDVWIFLGQFEQHLLMSFDGRLEAYGTSEEEDIEHMHTVLRTPITKQQEINFTEAALIRYFQPQYNDKFKYNFPNPAHTTYSQCYELDINNICFEVNTEELNTRLWSLNIKPEWIHFGQFPLHSIDERVDMFKF